MDSQKEEPSIAKIKSIFFRKFLFQIKTDIFQETVNKSTAIEDTPFLIILDNEAETMDAAALQPVFRHQTESCFIQKPRLVFHIKVRIPDSQVNDENGQRKEIPCKKDFRIEGPASYAEKEHPQAGGKSGIPAKTVLPAPEPHQKC